MILMVEKGIRGGICHAIYWYAETNNMLKITKSSSAAGHTRRWLSNTSTCPLVGFDI